MEDDLLLWYLATDPFDEWTKSVDILQHDEVILEVTILEE